ncbi:hypothetical protein HGG72_11635 [Ochrobactrum pecoris]|nr:hypothetical protein [Brucella pecoris]
MQVFSERAVSFQPAFPAFPKPDQIVRSDKKRNFFFYARPNHARNLYWRGLEVIDSAMRNGLFADNEWNINFVGQGIEPLSLPGDVSPKIWSNLSWSDYANFVSKMDLGLSLMDTPHPSYPPLDLAASGAIVVTNQHGIKNSLEIWSKNIITAPADTLSLVDALRVGAERSKNLSERHANCMNDNIERNWEASLGMAIDRLFKFEEYISVFITNFPSIQFEEPWLSTYEKRLFLLGQRRKRISYFYENPDTSTFRYRVFNPVLTLQDDHNNDVSASWFHLGDLKSDMRFFG